MQDRRVQIVHVDFFLGGVEAEIIRLSVNDAGFHSTTGQPNRITVRMMVAPDLVGLERALHHVFGPAKGM